MQWRMTKRSQTAKVLILEWKTAPGEKSTFKWLFLWGTPWTIGHGADRTQSGNEIISSWPEESAWGCHSAWTLIEDTTDGGAPFSSCSASGVHLWGVTCRGAAEAENSWKAAKLNRDFSTVTPTAGERELGVWTWELGFELSDESLKGPTLRNKN